MIADEFWTSTRVGGVVLTKLGVFGPWRRVSSSFRIHRFTQPMVSGQPEFAELVRMLNTRAVRAENVLRGLAGWG